MTHVTETLAGPLRAGEWEPKEIVEQGDPAHNHVFERAGGVETKEFDGRGLATFVFRFRCSCGAQLVRELRDRY